MAAGAKDGFNRVYPLYRRLTAPSGPAAHLREATLVIGLCLVYVALHRILGDDLEAAAFENAEKLIAFESAAGFFWEAGWNRWVVDMGSLLTAVINWIYILTFMLVVPVAALVYYVVDRDRYFQYRGIILLSFLLCPGCLRDLSGGPAADDGGVRLRGYHEVIWSRLVRQSGCSDLLQLLCSHTQPALRLVDNLWVALLHTGIPVAEGDGRYIPHDYPCGHSHHSQSLFPGRGGGGSDDGSVLLGVRGSLQKRTAVPVGTTSPKAESETDGIYGPEANSQVRRVERRCRYGSVCSLDMNITG